MDVQNICKTHVELDGRVTLAVLGGHHRGPDDLDGAVSGSVATGHIVICSASIVRTRAVHIQWGYCSAEHAKARVTYTKCQ